MDLSLPVMDGWEATRRLKAARHARRSRSSRCPRTPWRAIARRRSKPAVDDYDTKPVEFDRLLAKVNRLLIRK